MVGKRRIWALLVCIALLLPCGSAYGKTGGNTSQEADGSQILAGISVEYTGKLEFLVQDRDTDQPIEGASVEIYVSGENRYVLFGVTDENGRLKVDAAPGSEVRYRVYKSDWKPYPQEGTVQLQQSGKEQIVIVYLYRKNSGGSSGGADSDGSSSGGIVTGSPVGPGQTADSQEIQEVTGSNTKGIPKTGVDSTAGYWIAALICFLLAGLFLMYLLKLEKETEGKTHGR